MRGLETKLAAMEQRVRSNSGDNASTKDCGKGLLLEPGTQARWCNHHGYGCWFRYSPREEAQVAMALCEMERRRASGMRVWDDVVEAVLHGEPPAEVIQAARQYLLVRGYELEEGA